jgi:hypothetical protein
VVSNALLSLCVAGVWLALLARRSRPSWRKWLAWILLLVAGAGTSLFVGDATDFLLRLLGASHQPSVALLTVAAVGFSAPWALLAAAIGCWTTLSPLFCDPYNHDSSPPSSTPLSEPPSSSSTNPSLIPASDDPRPIRLAYPLLDPLLHATVFACGFGAAHVVSHPHEHLIHLAVFAFAVIGIVGTWGYGLALSVLDGSLGGSPLGRYSMTAIFALGAMFAMEHFARAWRLPIELSAVFAFVLFLARGALEISNRQASRTLAKANRQHRLRQLAAREIRQGGIRPLWVGFGALVHLGALVVGLVASLAFGKWAGVNLAVADSSTITSDSAMFLVTFGMIASYPLTAMLLGAASGGRKHLTGGTHFLESALAAFASIVLLMVLFSDVFPVLVTTGFSILPVACVLAGAGSWIATGRDL